MRSRLTCVISAAMAVLLIVCTVNYAFNTGREKKKNGNPVMEAAQKEVVVQDFIHDNYVITEKNPWTDYSLHPVNYKETKSSSFSENISAQSAILVDIKSNNVLYAKNENKHMYPASTTKLMTALTVLQIMNVNDVVTIGDEITFIASDSSKAGFSRGQVVTVKELLQGLLISSGNDAAYVLAKAAGQEIFEDNIANEGKTFTSQQCADHKEREFLTLDELTAMTNIKLEDPNMAFTRDLFIFGCWTGISFIDIKNLTEDNISMVNSAPWIVSKRQKTGVPFQIKLMDIPMQIVERYKSFRKGNHLFNIGNLDGINKRIKKVAVMCGIKKRVSFHVSRHSWAVLALEYGMPIESVSKILGHTNITTTQIYAKVTSTKLDHDIAVFESRIKGHLPVMGGMA